MKKTREQKRAEERAIIAQMEEGLQQTATPSDDFSPAEPTPLESEKKRKGIFSKPQDVTPEKIHCKRCKTLMEKGVCPVCGYKMYVPMDEKKRNAIRLALTAVFIGVFLILFIATRG